MLRHQERPKSQPPIKLNEVCSSYKQQQQRQVESQRQQQQLTSNGADDEHHWSKLVERYERSRSHFKGSLGSLEPLEELEDALGCASQATTTTMRAAAAAELAISSPSSSSSGSLASSQLSLSSTASSASTVLAAGQQRERASSSSSSSDEDERAAVSSASSSSGVSSTRPQTARGSPTEPERASSYRATGCVNNKDEEDAREVGACLAGLVAAVAAQRGAQRAHYRLALDAHMVKELEVEFLYEPSEFSKAQLIKLARRHIFSALKRANRAGQREPGWRVNLVQADELAPLISWYQTGGGQATSVELCVAADAIIDCLIEHELVVWLVERRPAPAAIQQVYPASLSPINGGERGQDDHERPSRPLVFRRPLGRRAARAEGGNLIGVEAANLHSIDALVWLCASEREAALVRDQWRLMGAARGRAETCRPAAAAAVKRLDENNNNNNNNNNNICTQQRDVGQIQMGARRLNETEEEEKSDCDDDLMASKLAGNLRNCRNSIFVHNAARLRPAEPVERAGSICDLSREQTPADGLLGAAAAGLSRSTASLAGERLRAATTSGGAVESSAAAAAGRLQRAESCSSVAARAQAAGAPTVKPRTSILKGRQQAAAAARAVATASPAPRPQQVSRVAAAEASAARQQKSPPASDRRLSVSSIRLNSNGCERPARQVAQRAQAKPKSILKNGSDERPPAECAVGGAQLQRRAPHAQLLAAAGESELGAVEPTRGAAPPTGELNKRRPRASEQIGGADRQQQQLQLRPPLIDSAGGQQRRKSVAHFESATSATGSGGGGGQSESEEDAKRVDDEDARFVSDGSLAREQAFERLRQRASCYDITRLMSKNSSIQSQLARLRAAAAHASAADSSARQRRPAELVMAAAGKQAAGRHECDTSARDGQRVSLVSVGGAPKSRCADADGTVRARGGGGGPLGQPLAERARREVEEASASSVVEVRSGAGLVESAVLPPARRARSGEAEAAEQSSDDAEEEEAEVGAAPEGGAGKAVIEVGGEQDEEEAEEETAEEEEEEAEAKAVGAHASLAAAKGQGGLSKFNLLRQSFNQKTISSMLKFSSRASLRIRAGAKPKKPADGDDDEQEIEASQKASKGRKAAAAAEVEGAPKAQSALPKQHKQAGPKLREQHRIDQQQQQQQQIAAIDSATLMLYNRHLQRQQQQQQQLLLQQQQQQQQQQYAFQWQQQMLIQQRQHHQQLAYMANHYHVSTAHHQHHQHHQQHQQQQHFLPPGALQPIGPVPMGASFAASAALYAAAAATLPQMPLAAHGRTHPSAPMSLIPQQQRQPGQSLVASAGTLLRKSILKSSSSSSSSSGKRQQQLQGATPSRIASYQAQPQSSQLIPLSVNHHSSVNIVYAEAGAAKPAPMVTSRGSSLGASMRKTVKSVLTNRSLNSSSHDSSKAAAGGKAATNPTTTTTNNNQPLQQVVKKQLKSALKQPARGRESIVLNSEGSDGDGSSTTVESSSSSASSSAFVDKENERRAAKPSILKKTISSTLDKSSMLSLASDTSGSSSSDDSNFKRATSTRCSRRLTAAALQNNKSATLDSSLRASTRLPQRRKNVTFSAKLTSIL